MGFDCDVVVIGGGPAGSTVAALLAEKGHRVTLLEKGRHPRFHIGESLLPANLRIFDRLGVGEQVQALGMEKRGAEFVSPWHEHRQVFEFGDAWDKSMPMAYQVRRSEFDEVLIRNASRLGAEVIEGCRVVDVDTSAGSDGVAVTGRHEDGREQHWRARFLVDASGRDTFMANRLKAKQRNPKHNSSAVYGHFRGARRLEGSAEGHITIFWFDHGWFWFIPLRDGATSVGATVWPYYLKGRNKPLKEFFLDTIAMCPALTERLKDAELVSEVEATGNFSYVTDHTYGENYLLLGDAFAFIDPVFSSGVMLAMQGGVGGAEAIDTILREPARRKEALARSIAWPAMARGNSRGSSTASPRPPCAISSWGLATSSGCGRPCSRSWRATSTTRRRSGPHCGSSRPSITLRPCDTCRAASRPGGAGASISGPSTTRGCRLAHEARRSAPRNPPVAATG